MDVSPAALKLRSQFKDSLQRAGKAKTPILTHVNADTTWLLSLAYPDQRSSPPGRSRYNILIDPWLAGPQEDVASWFSKQWHLIQSSAQTIAELNAMLQEAEESESGTTETKGEKKSSYIDAVVICHEFTDHCHRATLLEVDHTVPVFATSQSRPID